jgi:hypothetical protein
LWQSKKKTPMGQLDRGVVADLGEIDAKGTLGLGFGAGAGGLDGTEAAWQPSGCASVAGGGTMGDRVRSVWCCAPPHRVTSARGSRLNQGAPMNFSSEVREVKRTWQLGLKRRLGPAEDRGFSYILSKHRGGKAPWQLE